MIKIPVPGISDQIDCAIRVTDLNYEIWRRGIKIIEGEMLTLEELVTKYTDLKRENNDLISTCHDLRRKLDSATSCNYQLKEFKEKIKNLL